MLLTQSITAPSALAQTASAGKPAPVLLRLKFNQGDVFNYSMKMDINGTMKMTGIPGYEQSTGRKSLDIPMDMSMYAEFEIDVESVDADGAATVSISFDRIKMKNGQLDLFDSDNEDAKLPEPIRQFMDSSFQMKLATDGRVLSTTFPNDDKLAPELDEMKLDEMLKQNFITLPAAAISIGDKWKYAYDMKLPFSEKSNIRLEFGLELLGFEKIKDINSAVIGVKYNDDLAKQLKSLEIPAPGMDKPIKADLDKLVQKIEGKIYFANEHGFLLGSHLEGDQSIAGSFDIDLSGGKEPPSRLTMSADFTLIIDVELL